MKYISLKKYKYIGNNGKWYIFESRMYRGDNSERLLTKQAKVELVDGSYLYLDPIRDLKDERQLNRLLDYYNLLKDRNV